MSDVTDLFRRLRVKIQNLVQRGVVTVSANGNRYQGRHMGGRVADELENFQPQGLHFRVPLRAEYIQVHPAAEPANAVMLGAHVRGTLPTDAIPEGTGGLHYLGEFAVYIDEDQIVHLGGGIAAADFVALAGSLKTAIDNMLQAGVTAGGPGAANFTAAKTNWSGVASSTYSASKVKAT